MVGLLGLLAAGGGAAAAAVAGGGAAAGNTVKVDSTAAKVSSTVLAYEGGIAAEDGKTYLNAGDKVSVTVTMDEAVVVNTTNGTTRIKLGIAGVAAGTEIYAVYDAVATAALSDDTKTKLVFSYTIAENLTDLGAISLPANGLELNSGSIKDLAGTNANLAHAAVAADTNSVDTTASSAVVAADKILANDKTLAVESSEVGTAYLIREDLVTTKKADLDTILADEANNGGTWNSVALSAIPDGGSLYQAGLSLAGLTDGTYKLYTVDRAGNLSAAAGNTVKVDSTAPTQTTTVAISDDTDTAGDFITQTEIQTISGTLCARATT